MSPREQVFRTITSLLDERQDLALVYAEISGQFLADAARAHPDRVINVGIREQLLVSTGGGLALTGIRPVMHTFSAFLVERAFEQVKLDLAHQGVGGVLVGTGGSFDMAPLGRTHQSPGDVALAATVPGMRIHVPATDSETEAVLRDVVADDGLHYVRLSELTDSTGVPADGEVHIVRRGRGDLVLVALGAVRDEVLGAAEELDATVLATLTIHPIHQSSLRSLAGDAEDVVLVEPWLEGTALGEVASTLADRPRRFLAIGTRREELRRYGAPEQHMAAHGLRAPAIARRVRQWREAD